MNIEKACVGALAPHLAPVGLECEILESESALRIPSLGLDVHVTRADGRSNSVSATFEARPLGDAEGGMRVLAVGIGDTQQAATADAAAQWALGVLPVLRSYILHSHVCEVELFPMIVGVHDSPDRYGWTVHIGPVIGRAFGKVGDEDPTLGDLSRSAAYEPLFQVLHSYAAHRSLMWVESFAARYYSDQKLDATCRLNNRDIADGRDALLAWASGWPSTGAKTVSKRQFLILEPKPLDAVDESGDLRQRLEQEIRKSGDPWWRRLLGRRPTGGGR